MGIIPTKKTVVDGVKDAVKYGGAGAAVVVGRALAGPLAGAIAGHLAAGLVKNDTDKKVIRGNAWMDATVALLS